MFLKSRYVDMLGKCVLCEEIMNTYNEVKYEAVEVEVAVFGLPVDQVRTPEGSERAGGGPNSRATWRNKKLKNHLRCWSISNLGTSGRRGSFTRRRR